MDQTLTLLCPVRRSVERAASVLRAIAPCTTNRNTKAAESACHCKTAAEIGWDAASSSLACLVWCSDRWLRSPRLRSPQHGRLEARRPSAMCRTVCSRHARCGKRWSKVVDHAHHASAKVVDSIECSESPQCAITTSDVRAAPTQSSPHPRYGWQPAHDPRAIGGAATQRQCGRS